MASKNLSPETHLSNGNLAILTAYEKGYRVVDGEVYAPNGEKLSLMIQNTGNYKRHRFSIKLNGFKENVLVHRLVAYQKFGDKTFSPGVQVRHLDGDSLNNLESNIEIGGYSENSMDRPTDQRKMAAIYATSKNRKFTNAEISQIKELHKKGWGYKKLMQKFNISSKATLHHVLNHNYVTEKRI